MPNYSRKRGKLNTYAIRVAFRFYGKSEDEVSEQVKQFKKLFPTSDTKGALADALQWLYKHEHHELPGEEHILTEAYKAQVKYPGWEEIPTPPITKHQVQEAASNTLRQLASQDPAALLRALADTFKEREE